MPRGTAARGWRRETHGSSAPQGMPSALRKTLLGWTADGQARTPSEPAPGPWPSIRNTLVQRHGHLSFGSLRPSARASRSGNGAPLGGDSQRRARPPAFSVLALCSRLRSPRDSTGPAPRVPPPSSSSYPPAPAAPIHAPHRADGITETSPTSGRLGRRGAGLPSPVLSAPARARRRSPPGRRDPFLPGARRGPRATLPPEARTSRAARPR